MTRHTSTSTHQTIRDLRTVNPAVGCERLQPRLETQPEPQAEGWSALAALRTCGASTESRRAAPSQPAKLFIVGVLVLALGVITGMSFAAACSQLFRLVVG